MRRVEVDAGWHRVPLGPPERQIAPQSNKFAAPGGVPQLVQAHPSWLRAAASPAKALSGRPWPIRHRTRAANLRSVPRYRARLVRACRPLSLLPVSPRSGTYLTKSSALARQYAGF
jgi:hypothetical protein